MRTDHLREWLQGHRSAKVATEAQTEAEGETSGSEERNSATNKGTADGEEKRNPTKWKKVVELVQLAPRDGVLADEAAWQVVVLIPKGVGDYRNIGFMEVIWKAVEVILNHRFTAAITA